MAKRLLVACEFSGVVRRAFEKVGWEAISCDLLPSEDGSDYHIQGDVIPLLQLSWDLLIAHPPCTYLTVAGNAWYYDKPDLIKKAYDFFMLFVNQDHIPRIAVENPVGRMSTLYKKPDQIIQPYNFGHSASKKTCLWLKNLPLLETTKYIEPDEKGRWDNQTPSGQNKLGPSEDRSKIRSVTYEGIAEAMANQWGNLESG